MLKLLATVALFVLGRLGELATLPAHECDPMEIDEALEDSAPEAMRQSQHKSVQQASNYYNDAEAEIS